MKKGIYLGSCKAYHKNYNLDYNDVIQYDHINILGDMLKVDLTKYDFIIATPPCNYYSRANYRRETSEYAQATKHLLPSILKKCCELNKPFIIENVRNRKMFEKCGIFEIARNNNIQIIEYYRHTYFTNVKFNINKANQVKDDIQKKSYYNQSREGGENVYNVIEEWLRGVNK